MSQPHGRYSKPRDNGPRQPRPSEPSSRKQKKPFVKAQPARDPTQTASIYKTRSFKLLVDAAGAENIALGLDSNLTRVAELVNGIGFTPETAFHIETTLGLPDGFFDQPSPVLSPEIIARLKSPLDFIHAHVEPEPAYPEWVEPTQAASTIQQHTSSEHSPKEPEMPKKTSDASPRAVAKNTNMQAVKAAAGKSPKTAPAKNNALAKSSPQQSLLLNDDTSAVEKIRRANLHVLTSRNGSKVRLGTLMELSGSNMAHRLHGQKRLDDAETNRFTERLGLPAGWLDVPQIAADIPLSVATLLLPASRRHAAAQENALPVPRSKTAQAKPEGGNVRAARVQHASSADVTEVAEETQEAEANTERVQATVADEQRPAPMLQREPATSSEAGDALGQENDVPAAQALDEQPSLILATGLDNLQGIQPIAEALLKTLAGKARIGRLDETKALELLQQAVLL
jgi:hypothetical protein